MSQPPAITVSATRVTERVDYIEGLTQVASRTNRGFTSNAGFVVTDDGVVVIDALGTYALGAALLGAIREVTSKPVRRVVVTHYHADHSYGLQAAGGRGHEALVQASPGDAARSAARSA